MPCRRFGFARLALAAGTFLFSSLSMTASGNAQATKTASEHPDSKVDIYGGYGFFHPLNSGIGGKQYQDVSNLNATASVSYFFNHYVGVQAEGGYFSGNNEHAMYGCTGSRCDQLVYTAEGGPVVRYPLGSFVPFVHALGGGVKMNGPALQPLMWGWGVTGGAGVDYILPFFNKRFAARLVQADFQYSQVVYGPLVLPAGVTGGFGEVDALKLSGGLVARFGAKEDKQPVMLGCTAEPATVHPAIP